MAATPRWDGAEPLDEWAVRVTAAKLAEVNPRRWSHVAGVVELAREIRDVAGADGDLLVAAAAAHDIGWAPDLNAVGFSPLDGAVFVRDVGAPVRLAGLVANYFGSAVEGRLRGYGDRYAEFPDEQSAVRDALWYCDLRVGPDGHRMTVDHRLAEVRSRYGDDPVVGQMLDEVEPELRSAVKRTEERLAGLGLSPT